MHASSFYVCALTKTSFLFKMAFPLFFRSTEKKGGREMSKTIQSLLLLSLLGCSTEFPTRSNPRYIARDVEGDVGVPVPQGGEEGDSGTGGNQNILDSSLEVEDGFVQDARLLDSDVDQAQD